MDAKKPYPGFNDDGLEDNDLREELDAHIDRDTDVDDADNDTGETLKYNEDDDSFEYDVERDDDETYDHPDPYNTSVKNGADYDSTYDESNPYAVDEYIPKENLEMDVDKLGMHVDSGKITEVDPADEAISRTPEDYRDDLDAEGYPVNDKKILK